MKCKTCKNKSIKFGYCLKCWDELTPDLKKKTIESLVSTNTTKNQTKRREGDLVPPGAFTILLSCSLYPLVLMSNSWIIAIGTIFGLIGICLAYNKYYNGGGEKIKIDDYMDVKFFTYASLCHKQYKKVFEVRKDFHSFAEMVIWENRSNVYKNEAITTSELCQNNEGNVSNLLCDIPIIDLITQYEKKGYICPPEIKTRFKIIQN